MVLFKIRANGEYGYHYPVKCQGSFLYNGAFVQTKRTWPAAQSLETCVFRGTGLGYWRQEVTSVTRLCQHRLGQDA